jgi:hypothetical protein
MDLSFDIFRLSRADLGGSVVVEVRRLRVVVSHLCDGRKSQRWGTGVRGATRIVFIEDGAAVWG